MPGKNMPMVDPNSPERDRQMSGVLRGARTMGPGRPGGADSKAAIEELMMMFEPFPGSDMPSGLSAQGASQMVSDMRMAALMKAMQDASRLPAPMTR